MNDDAALRPQVDHIEIAADIVSTYVSHNSVPVGGLPSLLAAVHVALKRVSDTKPDAAASIEKPTPAQIRKSITPDALISFEDGRPYRTLKRHLTTYGLTPEAYRTKWGLPRDYPMTSAAYAAQRSELARKSGLGRRGQKAAAAQMPVSAETAQADTAAKPKAKGRSKDKRTSTGASV